MKLALAVFALLALGDMGVADADRRFPPKPTAPVDVRLEARPARGGYDVTIVATPTADVAGLTLRVAGREQRVGTTPAGATRTFRVHVPIAAGEGADVVGSAAV
ncbi:MAG: hypothetical protein KIT31_30985, partial [Deltaproteobacteria bacterium]|nr:hypothetical protein [Deltaproteobacteria bacterium]